MTEKAKEIESKLPDKVIRNLEQLKENITNEVPKHGCYFYGKLIKCA